MSNENAQDFEERDDHVLQLVVSKCEERKLIAQTEFETVCTKYWNLLKGQAPSDENTISKDQYCALLTRIYRVLAPLYRDAEMEAQVAQEWVYDSHNSNVMDQNLFMKFIFRIAHQWATSIDINEYIELLEKVYSRITHKVIVRSSGATQVAYPHIQVTIDQEKQPQNEDFGDADWEMCEEGEEEEPDHFTYEQRDDGKTYKQRKPAEQEEAIKDVFLTARDPFYFKEVVKYHQANENGDIKCAECSLEDFDYDVMTEHCNVFPLGYPTEQYLSWVKNDVHKALAEVKAAKKKTIMAMKRDLFNNADAQKAGPTVNADRERGLIEENGRFVTQHFTMYRTSNDALNVETTANMHDATYNSLRNLFKDNSQMQIRPSFDYPTRKGHTDKSADLGAPLKRFSAFGFNPTLERRLNYVFTQCKVKGNSDGMMWINVNYLICDPVYDTAYRSDVQRCETNNKMAIKPNEEFTRDEDFNCVSTSFRDAVQIMLQKKYESFFTIKLQGDSEAAVERDEETFKQERERRKLSRKDDALTGKGLWENFDGKEYLKIIRGPFYKLQSKAGPSEDTFETCATQDLIDIANKEVIKLFILAKPRSGKTTLANQLKAKLNLVRVAADAWIEKLFVKVAYYVENPPEPLPVEELAEGDEGPPNEPEIPNMLNELETEVSTLLKAGGAPSEEQICMMLKEMIASPEAQT
jgi:hypothetical protein